MKKALLVGLAVILVVPLVVSAKCPQISVISPPDEIDGSSPFYIRHGFVFISDEEMKDEGYHGPRDAAENMGILFELYIDGEQIAPTYVRPERSKGTNPTTGIPFSGWAYHWYFRFAPGAICEGEHTFTGHWIWPEYMDMWITRSIDVM